MKTLILARHGENDVMHTRLAGRLPGIHLNAQGQQQASALVNLLAGLPVQAVFSSPLERALETAQPLAAARQLSVQPWPAFIEVDYGTWAGRTFKQLYRTRLWKQLRERPSSVRFPGGETLAEVQCRALAGLQAALAAVAEGQALVCVSHGDVIRLLTASYLNMPLDDYQRLIIDPGAVTVIRVEAENAPLVVQVNHKFA